MTEEHILTISTLLGQSQFTDLILSLPGSWHLMSLSEKQQAWRRIHHAVVHGEKNTARLVGLVTTEAER